MFRRSLFVLVAAAALLSPTAAAAALPPKNADYAGRTAQNLPVAVEVSRASARRLDLVGLDLRTTCGKLGRVRGYDLDVERRVRADGSFAGSFTDVEVFDFDDAVIEGRLRTPFDVSRTTYSGRFTSRRRVVGTWEVRSLVFDERRFPDEGAALDTCATGRVEWSATLRR